MSPDLAASIKARLLAQAKRQKEEFERTLARYAAGRALQRSIAACFERRATPLASEPPEPLTPTFYAHPELVDRWRSYLAVSRPIVVPPASFSVLGEEITRFLGPVHHALATAALFAATWPPGGPWHR